MEKILNNHHQSLRKYSRNLQKQKEALQIIFLEHHTNFTKFQTLFQKNRRTLTSYMHMVVGMKQTQRCHSWLLRYLEGTNMETELFLPVEMKVQQNQLQKIKEREDNFENNTPFKNEENKFETQIIVSKNPKNNFHKNTHVKNEENKFETQQIVSKNKNLKDKISSKRKEEIIAENESQKEIHNQTIEMKDPKKSDIKNENNQIRLPEPEEIKFEHKIDETEDIPDQNHIEMFESSNEKEDKTNRKPKFNFKKEIDKFEAEEVEEEKETQSMGKNLLVKNDEKEKEKKGKHFLLF